MVVKVFLTGVTGYIGGDAFHHVQHNHPDFEFALLVRSEEKANAVLAKYPNVRIVIGGLDDAATLEREASWADIVIRKLLHFKSVPWDNLTSQQILPILRIM